MTGGGLDTALRPVIEVIEGRLGTGCDGFRADITAEAIRGLMAVTATTDPVNYAGLLQRDPAARAALAEALRVPETYFLREPKQLAFLGDHVLPGLTAHEARRERPLQIWSAGCSSGEEAYSLRIVLERAGLVGRGRIRATDRSTAALKHAERGIYRAWSLRGLAVNDRQRYFEPAQPDGGSVVVADRLREGVSFERHDLVTDPFPTDLDLIVCRNVLLYLTPEHGAAVIERFAGALAPGGWLLLGSADPRYGVEALLEAVRMGAGSLYRRPDREAPSTDPPTRRDPQWASSLRAGISLRQSPDTAGCAATPPTAGTAPPRSPLPTPSAPDVRPGGQDTAQELRAELVTCELELEAAPLDAVLHARHATLLLDSSEPARATHAAIAALFLDPGLVAAHLLLGRSYLATGDHARAGQAFVNATDLLVGMPADAAVPASSHPAGRLLEVAEAGVRHAATRRDR